MYTKGQATLIVSCEAVVHLFSTDVRANHSCSACLYGAGTLEEFRLRAVNTQLNTHTEDLTNTHVTSTVFNT